MSQVNAVCTWRHLTTVTIHRSYRAITRPWFYVLLLFHSARCVYLPNDKGTETDCPHRLNSIFFLVFFFDKLFILSGSAQRYDFGGLSVHFVVV